MACTDKEDDTTETSTETTTETTTETDTVFAPQEGAWLTGEEMESSDCGWKNDSKNKDDKHHKDDGAPDELYLVLSEDGTTFTLGDEDKIILDCALDGMAFTCEFLNNKYYSSSAATWTDTDTDTDTDTHDWDMDADIDMVDMSVGGDFTTTTEGMVELSQTIDCVGADCDELIEMMQKYTPGFSLPCTTTTTVAITAK